MSAVPILIQRTRNRHSRAVLQNDTIVIRLARNLSQWEEQKHIQNLFQRMSVMLQRQRQRIRIIPLRALPQEQRDVAALVHQLNADTFNVPLGNIRLRAMRSQWGSCSSRGNITLNTALLQLSRPLLEYVIIHELAHRIVKNHSKRFWDLVESVCPGSKEARRELRTYTLTKASSAAPLPSPSTPPAEIPAIPPRRTSLRRFFRL